MKGEKEVENFRKRQEGRGVGKQGMVETLCTCL